MKLAPWSSQPTQINPHIFWLKLTHLSDVVFKFRDSGFQKTLLIGRQLSKRVDLLNAIGLRYAH